MKHSGLSQKGEKVYNGKREYILCYTREPQDDMIYSNRLAFSMHLAYSEDEKDFSALEPQLRRPVRQGNGK